jgi:hypothetical protein
MGTALNPFGSLPYIRMYGKVPESFFLSYIGHIMAATRQLRMGRVSVAYWPVSA